jgi:hypothetical protein
MDLILKRIRTVLNSHYFFWAVLAFFIFESAWIALSAVYPMAFDENFHFGLIKTYSHYWLPFLSSQPPGADAYSAVPRDPSYLYHYVMSFPYRLTAQFVHGQTTQVIILRFINIGLFASGIVLFRRVLLRSRLTPALTHLILALFVLLPVVPLLAGQVNYDNLLFPLVGWACLLTMRVSDELQSRKPSVRAILMLISLCIFATLVKYEFLPIFAGIVLFLLYITSRSFGTKWHSLGSKLRKSWRSQSVRVRFVLITLFLLSLGMFAQRDGYNLVKYHTFTPDCSKVLDIHSCSAYSPWDYNYHNHLGLEEQKSRNEKISYENPLSYTGWWAYWLWYRTFFAVDGPKTDFTNYPPLPLPAAMGALIGIGSILAVCLRWRNVLKSSPYMLFFLIVSLIYLIALWVEGYIEYRHTGVLEIMNGRYVLPILLLLIALMGKAIAGLLRNLPVLKISLTALALIFFLEGGGFLTFIMRSDAKWDWPNSYAINVNDTARKVLHPVILEGKKTYTTKVWMFN